MRLRKTAAAAMLCLAVLGGGCAAVEPEQHRSATAPVITCIAILPAGTVIDYDSSLSHDQAKSLKQGAQVMDKMLVSTLEPRHDVRFLTEDKLQNLTDLLPGDPLAVARLAGKHLSCNTALETTMQHYTERVGGQLSAQSPASVAFSYRLIDLEKGRVLCKGQFHETQQSVMANLLDFTKARQRGFTWITAEELLREGLEELFVDCPLLDDAVQK